MRVQDKDPQTDYQIKDLLKHRGDAFEVFEVTKWTGGRVPENIYTVRKNLANGHHNCNCPAAFRGKCKHVDMVQEFERAGRPATFPTLEKLEAL